MTSPIRAFWHSPNLMDRLSAMVFLIALLCMVMMGLWWVANRPVFVIKRVMVDSVRGELTHTAAQKIRAALDETVSGTVLSTDIAAIHRAVQALPWVRHASVRRIWPNRLLIRIEEHHAVAVWDGKRLLNHYGEVFEGSVKEHHDDCALIALSGPAGSEKLVLERARQLQNWLAPLGLPLQAITLSEQYAWTAYLGGGVTLELGRDALPTPVQERVQMFVKSQPWLARQQGADSSIAQISKVDLRYPTGYAYRPASQPIAVPVQSLPLCIGAQT